MGMAALGTVPILLEIVLYGRATAVFVAIIGVTVVLLRLGFTGWKVAILRIFEKFLPLYRGVFLYEF